MKKHLKMLFNDVINEAFFKINFDLHLLILFVAVQK